MSTCHVGCAAQLAGQLVVLAQEGRQPQRSDRRLPTLSCPWALEAVWLTRRRRADFHQGQERTMKLLKQAEYMARTGFTFHPTIAFRSGMGPYMGQLRGLACHTQYFCQIIGVR